MLDSLSLWLHETPLGETLLTMLISMLPVVELRGGLPAGVAMGLPIPVAFIASLVGNMIGRNLDYALGLEGSLKLKEISYIHSEAYASGELKHGTISLIEDGTLVIALGTYAPLFDKAMSNVVEVKARGADVLALATESHRGEMAKTVENVITIPDTAQMLLPSLGVVPLQLLAYYIALQRGCDIDKPRNLAKSVTVE